MSTALAQAPPADATRLLYERHSSRIFGFCLSRLGSREEAEDAVQTTFLNAQRGLGRGVTPQYELAWLFKIAQNVCHNRHQSARRRGRVEASQDLDSLQDVIASPERSAAVSLGELTHALGAIPKRQRQALLLREFQGYSYEEIADELGVTIAAVETLLFRARRGVAQQLEQAGAKPASRRGAIASVFELFRWLFGGGAAPLKVAAVTAAVATTATLAVVPAVRDGNSGPAAPTVVTTRHVVPAVRGASTTPGRHVVRPASSQPAPVQQQTAVHTEAAPASPTAAAPTPPVSSTTAAPVTEASAPDSSLPPPNPPALAVPEVTVPPVSVPDLPVPEVTVPSVQVPLQLQVQLPQLP